MSSNKFHQDIAVVELNNSGNIHRTFLNKSIGKGDSYANRFGVRLLFDGEPVNLGSASCIGLFMAPNGQNILISGSDYTYCGGNIAYVQLPQACYNVEGQFTLAIKVIGDGVTGTMRIIDGTVDNTGVDGAVAPVESVPTYQEILAVYDQMLEAKDGAVRFDIEQELTDAQQTSARENIGAGAETILTALDGAVYDERTSLSKTKKRLTDMYIDDDGTISENSLYDLVCIELTYQQHNINIQLTKEQQWVYGIFEDEPFDESVTFDSTRHVVAQSKRLENITIPGRCSWIAIRVEKGTDAYITQEWLYNGASYTTPEEWGAVGDGVTNDTEAFVQAAVAGVPIIALKEYSVDTLSMPLKLYGYGKGKLIFRENGHIFLRPDTILDGLTIVGADERVDVIRIDTTSNTSNGVFYNSYIRNCVILCADESTAIYFYLKNGRGAMNLFFENLDIKCKDSNAVGQAVITIHTNQDQPSRPWMASIVFDNIVSIEGKFKYFIICDEPVKSDSGYSNGFYRCMFSNCQFQYRTDITRYCGILRGFKNTIFDIITYDFPDNSALYFMAEQGQTIEIKSLPLSHNNLAVAIRGVQNAIHEAGSIENANYKLHRYVNIAERYDSYSDTGSYVAYPMPITYPVGFTDQNDHKINGISIPQSAAVKNSADGSIIFGYDNDAGYPVIMVYSTSENKWIKYRINVDEVTE